MLVVFRSEGRPTNIVLSPNMKYVFIFCYDSGVSYNPLLFWAHRKWLHIWPIMRHLNCYRRRKLLAFSQNILRPAASYFLRLHWRQNFRFPACLCCRNMQREYLFFPGHFWKQFAGNSMLLRKVVGSSFLFAFARLADLVLTSAGTSTVMTEISRGCPQANDGLVP